jgi:phosphotransferase system HPr (HPr) family protein
VTAVPEQTVALRNPSGLHARPAQQFAQAAARFDSVISLRKQGGNSEVDAKSVLSVLTLDCIRGDEIVIRAEGKDAERAVTHLTRLVEEGIGEEIIL